jgi:RNA binding exosome subunit
MPEERVVKAAEVSVFAHATEDEEKVKRAVKNLAPFENTFQAAKLSGHYDDPITLLTLKISNKKEATDFFEAIYAKLSSLDRKTILDNLFNHIDDHGSFYLRLDKQKAYNGRVVLQENDSIRIKFKFQFPFKADPVTIIREYFLNLEDEEVQ